MAMNLAPYTGNTDLDSWTTEITRQLNSGELAGATSVEVSTDDEGRPVIGGVTLGYEEDFLHTRYATSADGSQGFTNDYTTISGLTVFQGLRNSSSAAETTNPADYTWRQLSVQTGWAPYYNLIGGRQIEWMFATSPPVNFSLDDGSINIDLTAFVSGEQGPPGDAGLTVFLSISTGNIFRNQAGPNKTITAQVFDGTNGEVVFNQQTSNISFKWTRSNPENPTQVDVYLADDDLNVQPRGDTTGRIADGIDQQGGRPGSGRVNTNRIIVGEEDVATTESFFCEVEYNA